MFVQKKIKLMKNNYDIRENMESMGVNIFLKWGGCKKIKMKDKMKMEKVMNTKKKNGKKKKMNN